MLRGFWILGGAALPLIGVGCGQSTEALDDAKLAIAAGGGPSAPTGACKISTAGGPSNSLVFWGATDGFIEQAAPSTNHGSTSYVEVKGGSNRRHGLLRWDTSNVAPGTIVKKACIRLFVEDPSDDVYPAYEMLRSWSQSSVTWSGPSLNVLWDAPGAWGAMDSGAVKVASIDGGVTGFTSVSLDSALVQRWIDAPADNHGIIWGNDTSFDGVSFSSSEAASSSARPQLTIVK